MTLAHAKNPPFPPPSRTHWSVIVTLLLKRRISFLSNKAIKRDIFGLSTAVAASHVKYFDPWRAKTLRAPNLIYSTRQPLQRNKRQTDHRAQIYFAVVHALVYLFARRSDFRYWVSSFVSSHHRSRTGRNTKTVREP